MITLHLNTTQRGFIVEALRELADRLSDPTCAERSYDDPVAVDADIDDLRDMADLIEDAEDN